MRRLGPVLLAALLLPLLWAAPASAHAALLHSDPHDGDVLGYTPRQVVLTFSEPVGTALGAVRVVGPDGERVDTGGTTTRDGRTEVVAPLEPGLAEGTYVLLWRVVSEDSHPVSGASTFSVGRPSAAATSAAEQDAGGLAGTLLTAARGVLFAGLVLLVGGVAVVVGLWREGRAAPAVRRLLWTGWSLVLLASLASLLLQGPYAAGLPLSDALQPALLSDVLVTRFGGSTAARLALLLPAAVVLVALPRVPLRGLVVAALPVGAGLLLTTSLVGHAAAGELVAVALPADVLHLAAVSVWLGGLAVLLLGVLRTTDATRLGDVLPRWSRWAAASVAVLVATGLFASWREVRAPEALATGYGGLLLAKTALVAAMLVLGAVGRAWVRRHHVLPVVHASTLVGPPPVRPAPDAPAVARLRRGVLLEAGVAVAVLAVTAVLVETTPARVAYAPPFSATATVEAPLRVQVELEPARVGLNQVHAYYTGVGGLALDVEEVTARLVSEDGDIVPLQLPRTTLGHYEQLTVPLPVAGEWRLELTTRTSDVDSTTTPFRLRVR